MNQLKLKELGLQLKSLFLSPKGWLSWIIANIITTAFWIIPLVIGFILQDQRLYALSASIWALMLSPIIPVWVVNVLIATFFYKKVLK